MPSPWSPSFSLVCPYFSTKFFDSAVSVLWCLSDFPFVSFPCFAVDLLFNFLFFADSARVGHVWLQCRVPGSPASTGCNLALSSPVSGVLHSLVRSSWSSSFSMSVRVLYLSVCLWSISTSFSSPRTTCWSRSSACRIPPCL